MNLEKENLQKVLSFCFFAQNMSKYTGKNITKNSSDKQSSGIIAALHQRLYHAKQSGPDAIKTGSKRAIQKMSKTCNL